MDTLGLTLVGPVPGANRAHVLDEEPVDFSSSHDIALLLISLP